MFTVLQNRLMNKRTGKANALGHPREYKDMSETMDDDNDT